MVRAEDPPGSTIPPRVLDQLAGGGDWISSWWTVVVALALAGLVVLWAVRRHRADRWSWPLWVVAGAGGRVHARDRGERHRRLRPERRRRTGVPGQLGHRVPAAAAGARDRRGPVGRRRLGPRRGRPRARPRRGPDARQQPDVDLHAAGLREAGSTRYPVVYLVHGSPGAGGDWFAAGNVPHAMDVLLENHLVEPMIVVGMDVNGTGPSAEDTECLDSTTGGSQVETYISETVIPWVDAQYRTADDWRHRAIGGFSSGGFCALDQGLRHPELYGAILALDTTGDPGTGGQAMLATQAQWDQHDVTTYAKTVPLPHPVALFVDIAGANHGQPRADLTSIAADLRARGRGRRGPRGEGPGPHVELRPAGDPLRAGVRVRAPGRQVVRSGSGSRSV